MHVSTFIWKHFIIGQVTWLERQIMSKSDNLMLSLNHSDPESMGESFTCAIGFSTSPLMWSTVSYAKVLFMQLHYIGQQKNCFILCPVPSENPANPLFLYPVVSGLRKVYPYPYTFSTYAKERWYGRTIQDIFENEFRVDSPDNFVSIPGGGGGISSTWAIPTKAMPWIC